MSGRVVMDSMPFMFIKNKKYNNIESIIQSPGKTEASFIIKIFRRHCI
jgi:hypothetical protein